MNENACEENFNLSANDFEAVQNKPKTADYQVICTFVQVLSDEYATDKVIESSLVHLQITLADYPCEYLLQPPHLLLKLLALWRRSNEMHKEITPVLDTLLIYVQCLKKRLHMPAPWSSGKWAMALQEKSHKQQQLRLNAALNLIMSHCIMQLKAELQQQTQLPAKVYKLMLNLQQLYAHQQLKCEVAHLQQLFEICEKLQKQVQSSLLADLQKARNLRHKYLLCIFLMQQMIINNGKDNLLNENDNTYAHIELLNMLFTDYAVQTYFPQQMQTYRKFLMENCIDLPFKRIFMEFDAHQASYTHMLQLLMQARQYNSAEIIEKSVDNLYCLLKLESTQLLHLLINAVHESLPQMIKNTVLKQKASKLLLNLLQIPLPKLRFEAYDSVLQLMKKFFICIIDNYEKAATKQQLRHLLAGVPLSGAFVQQVMEEYASCANEELQEICLEILNLPLRVVHVDEEFKQKYLQLLQPVLPLLQCLCSTDTAIFTNHILELGNPDAEHLPVLDILRLNCGLLFNKDTKLRSEALTRIIYMLQSLDVHNIFLPNIMQVSGLLPADLCILQPSSVNAVYSNKNMRLKSDQSILSKALRLLELKHNTHPLTRKSALIQLNVLLQNWQLMALFMEQHGPFLVLETLEQCLKHSAINEYTSSAVPAVGLLCKTLFFDEVLRHELSKTINMYVLLLRTLFIFHNDYQVRQDVSFALTLLLFNEHVNVMPPTDSSSLIELQMPVVVQLIACPLEFENYLKSAGNRTWRKNGSIFKNTQSELQYLRALIATVACNKLENVDENYVEKQSEKLFDINTNLHLSLKDCRLILITNMQQSMQHIIFEAENAIEESSLMHYLHKLELQLILLKTNELLDLDQVVVNQLVIFLDKYLQILPKHKQQNLLYSQFISLTAQCLNLPNKPLQTQLCSTFSLDCKHTLFVLLRNEHENIGNNLFFQLSCFITLLFQQEETVNDNYMQLFEQLMLMLQAYFKKRDFQRVRCLLILLRQMIQGNLILSDEQLFKKCKLLLHISFTLKSFHYTGAQLQRDCLFIVLHMHAKMQEPHLNFKPQPAIVKNLANLAATHQCAEVRTLVWCLIKNFMQFKSPTENGTQMIVAALESAENILDSELEASNTQVAYFANVCLNILMARHELTIVRTLAGYAFIDILVHNCLSYETALSLLQQHDFFAYSLRQCENALLNADNVDILNCQIVILQNLLHLDASYAKQLCGDQRCMQTMQNLIKRKDLPESMQYGQLCANICQVFALCAVSNYKYVQRTLCQDSVFLTNFVQLFSNMNCQNNHKEALKLIQLFLVFCQDATTVNFLLQQFDKSPADLIGYFLSAFNKQNFQSKLQNTALVLFSQLLISTSQKNIFCHILGYEMTSESGKYAFEVITALLHELFSASYTLNCPQFDVSPTIYKQNLLHTFSTLLRCCTGAYDCAQHMKLLDYVLNVLQHFFDEYTVASNTLPARYADKRRLSIIQNLQLFVQFLLTWHAATYAIISDEIYANRMLKMLNKIWTWANQNINLKFNVLQLCAVLSEQSLIIARKFSTGVHANGDTLLQTVAKIAKAETCAVRAQLPSYNYVAIIEMSLRIVMNCCACLEGRMSLVKISLVDVIHNLHPFNMKASKQKPEILHNWLQFWELFSRYPEGAKAIYLSSLCQVISTLSVNSKFRLICLCILRNFCFQANNRTALMASNDFIHTAYDILSRPVESTDMLEEKFIIITGLWKLISGGAKFVSNIRGTKLAKKMCIFCEQFSASDSLNSQPQSQLKNHDFHNVLKVIYDILNE